MTSKKHYVAVAREIAELLKDLEGSNAAINANRVVGRKVGLHLQG
jgi:hypothetical protein